MSGPDADAASLDAWIERQLAVSTRRLLASVSATHLSRPGPRLGQVMTPKPGSVLAAPEAIPGPDEPDYFFHWFRDAALVMDALVTLRRWGRLPDAAVGRFGESLAFDTGLLRLDGRAIAADGAWPPAMVPWLQPFLRPRDEFAAAHGAAAAAEVRCNPDGTLDLLRWSRPQHDGPALRALTTLRLLDCGALVDTRDRRRADTLLNADLRFCLSRHALPCIGPWEEESGHHFYTRLVQHAALHGGALWAGARGRSRLAARLAGAATALGDALAAHWSPDDGAYLSILPGPGISEIKKLDSVVLLAVLHADRPDGPFSVLDPKVEATVARLEDLFAGLFPVNAGRGPADGLLLGRYRGDVYVGGGAFLPCCFALATFHYRRADRLGAGRDGTAFARGDAVLAFLRRLLPADGRLPEQLDRTTGAPRSAGDLAWSHAAFVTAAAARAALA